VNIQGSLLLLQEEFSSWSSFHWTSLSFLLILFDTQQFLNPLLVDSGELSCQAVLIHCLSYASDGLLMFPAGINSSFKIPAIPNIGSIVSLWMVCNYHIKNLQLGFVHFGMVSRSVFRPLKWTKTSIPLFLRRAPSLMSQTFLSHLTMSTSVIHSLSVR